MRANRKVFNQRLLPAFLLLLYLTLSWQPVWAGGGSEGTGNGKLPGIDGGGWDAFFAREMENFDVYGAVMVAVADGQVVFEQGYGYADAVSQARMDPGSTIVRAGSIAKTVTALAVLQLAEQGKLDLDSDVNDYLRAFKVPSTFSEPVTARQLINMTAGFDTHWVGIRATSPEGLLPLGEYLAAHLPARVQPPGKIRRYNDHELALVGYLVEVASGMPYEEYVRREIFAPLEMIHSSIYLPEDQLGQAARGYAVGAGPQQAYPFSYYYLQDAPGSGFNTTARDLSHLMLAHLQDGSYMRSDGRLAQVLQPASMRAMYQTAFAYHPNLPGQANSFDEEFFNGHRYLRKYGGAPGMNNCWLLLPEQGLSLYLFYNSDGYGLRNAWQSQALSSYLSEPPAQPARYQPIQNSPAQVRGYSGLYREISDETSDTTIVKVQALVNPDLTVKVDARPDGGLNVWGRTFVAVEPDLFMGSGPSDLIYFESESGRPASYLYRSRVAFRRVAWLETPGVQLGLAGFALLVFVSVASLAVVKSWQRKAKGYRLAGLIAGLNLAFLAGLSALLLPVATGGDLWQFSFSPSFPLRLVLFLPLAAACLALGLLFTTIRSWRERAQPLTQRLVNALALAGMAAWLVFLQTWNLLGWRF